MEREKIKSIVERAFQYHAELDSFELRTMMNYIQRVADHIIQNYREEDPNEILVMLFEHLKSFNNDYCNVANLKGKYLQLNAMKKAVKNQQLFIDMVRTVKENEGSPQTKFYSSNLKENEEQAAREIIEAMLETERKRQALIKLQQAQGKRQVSTTKAKYFSDMKDEQFAAEAIKMAKSIIPGMEQKTKDELKKSLKLMFDFFDEFHLADPYLRQQKTKMRLVSLGELDVDLLTGKTAEGPVTFSQLFTDQALEQLETNDLMMLNLFYQNRLAKEITMIGEAFLAIQSTGLMKDILTYQDDPKKLRECIEQKCTREEWTLIKNKENWLNAVMAMIYRERKKVDVSEEDIQQGYVVIPMQEDMETLQEEARERYKQMFQSTNVEARMEQDVPLWEVIRNITENIYKIKDHILNVVICEQVQDAKKSPLRNFGVIQEREGRTKKILIGLDIEGLSMPIKVHADTNDLAEILRENYGNCILPEYEGAEDFWVNNSLLSTSLLLPITKAYEIRIRELREKYKGTEVEPLLNHLLFLSNQSKYPEHLMDKRVDKKGRIKFSKREKRYRDIQTGKKYTLRKKGVFEEITTDKREDPDDPE